MEELLEILQDEDHNVIYKKGKPHPYFYRRYLEFLRTGEYPYLDDTTKFAKSFLPKLSETQEKNLRTQMFYASQTRSTKEKKRQLRELYRQNWKPIKEVLELPNNTKIELYTETDTIMGMAKKKTIYKVFHTREKETYLMKLKATKKGIHIGNFWNREISLFKLI